MGDIFVEAFVQIFWYMYLLSVSALLASHKKSMTAMWLMSFVASALSAFVLQAMHRELN